MLPQSILRRALAAVALALSLSACGGAATPQLIGSYPREAESGAALPEYTAPPANLLVVYSANLELEVRDVDAAARSAQLLAQDYGGYLAASRSWRSDGRKYTTLTLAVPVAYFDRVYDGVRGLGTVIHESVSGDLTPAGRYEDEWNTYTHITLSLRPEAPLVSLPAVSGGGWNPARTFVRAFSVAAVVFRVVVDLLIWVVVLGSPVALVAWAVRAAWRKLKRPKYY